MNPVKIEGTQRAFAAIMPESAIECQGVDIPSPVAAQPNSMEETIKGALLRAEACFTYCAGQGDYFVGNEAGTFSDQVGDQYTISWAAIRDHEGHLGKGCSSAFCLPTALKQKIAKGTELSDAADQSFNSQKIGTKGGVVSLLSNGLYTRTDKVYEATLNALLPLINKCLFFTNPKKT